ncbi:MAG: outer membrane protein assembly factor BamA [Deltaproteobacteria bacterium]|jgi:outer membrane protein insertion porin family|nr:outer membrane protein assembly factor BamA [Deltaproteobacteria bacterium]
MSKLITSFLAAIAFYSLSSGALLAQEGQKVAVAPYTIVGVTGTQLEQIASVAQSLLDVTVQALASQGFQAVALGGQTLSSTGAAVQAQARDLGADYLFTASLTRTTDSYTLSGQLVALGSGGKSSERMDVFSSLSENLQQSAQRLIFLVTDHLFGSGPRVVNVTVSGSQMLESQAILNSLRIRQGGTYNEAKAASDIRRIHSLGYFDTVNVEVTDVAGGKSVRFVVTERPQIALIEYRGNENYDKDDLDKVIGVKPMDVASDDKILQTVANIQRFYAEKGYTLAKVNYELEPMDVGKAKLILTISEGGRLYIDKIEFLGNEFYGDWKLSRVIESKEKGFLSFVTGSGKLDQEKLANDSQLLLAHYHNNGFLQARVGEPEVSPSDKTDAYTVSFPIIEGPRFRVGTVTIGGDLNEDDDPDKMLDALDTPGETWFSREILMEDQNTLAGYYKDKGYFYADVETEFGEPTDDFRLNVNFRVIPGQLVYYDRIVIVGNERTRDKVVRRMLEVAEGDLTSQSGILASQNNLMRSSYFEDVTIIPSNSRQVEADLLDLRVEVKERNTGSFQIGAGYSNYSSVFGTVRLSQDNLFGYGRRVAIDANIGGSYNYFDLSFTDPWVGDIPLMMGFDLFKTANEYDYYRKDSIGGSIRAGYPVFERFYLSGSYTWEDVKIKDVSFSSSQYLTSMMGSSRNSIFSVSLRRDTRNHFFQPTDGSTMRLTAALATGFLGGATSFSRYELELARWIPVPFWDGAAVMGHVEVGLEVENKTGGLPVYEKYMLGGINSIRGYDWYDVSPKDPRTGENIGGEKMGVVNLEFTFPILEDSGLFAVFFYDMGNVWAKSQTYSLSDLKRSYGGGLRYLSPMGPLRIEYGKALDAEGDESGGRWEFTMGTMF